MSRGVLVLYPTEGVIGIACDHFDEQAVLDLLALKRRSVSRGLIVIGANIEQLSGLVDFPAAVRETVLNSWPGPQT